ncbi:MAG: PEP-CTERM sorting domain-containing protein [Planctomycetes bacterium]|nr:PEP-CTERM sorting domain-containing protein [Planctomycetota bacterium]
MMKRLLLLMLVLGMASSANAVLIQVDGQDPGQAVDITEGFTSVISVVSEDTSSWLGYIIVEEGGTGILGDAARLDAAGDIGTFSVYTEAGWGAGYELTVSMSQGGVPAIAVGPQFTINYSGGVLGETARISLFLDPSYENPVDSVAITIVPEPMTVILLGLGGLFLRRRK